MILFAEITEVKMKPTPSISSPNMQPNKGESGNKGEEKDPEAEGSATSSTKSSTSSPTQEGRCCLLRSMEKICAHKPTTIM